MAVQKLRKKKSLDFPNHLRPEERMTALNSKGTENNSTIFLKKLYQFTFNEGWEIVESCDCLSL